MHFCMLHFPSLRLVGKSLTSNNKSDSPTGTDFLLLMLLSWEAFIRKLVIHSTNMCRALGWLYRDEGYAGLQETHILIRERVEEHAN